MKRQRDSFMDTAKRTRGSGISKAEINKIVKRAIAQEEEKKAADFVWTAAIDSTLSNNTGVYHVNELNLGDSSYYRQGQVVKMDGLRIKGILRFYARQELITGNWEAITVRMSLLQQFDCEGRSSNPNWNSVFGYVTQTGTTGANLYSNVLREAQGSYRLLRDVTFTADKGQFMIHSGLSSHDCIIEVPYDIYVPLNGKKAEYEGNNSAGTVGAMKKNALFLCWKASKNQTHAYCFNTGEARLTWRE
jgi:hypothetical protein